MESQQKPMPTWAKWLLIGVAAWVGLGILVGCVAMMGASSQVHQHNGPGPGGGCFNTHWKPIPC